MARKSCLGQTRWTLGCGEDGRWYVLDEETADLIVAHIVSVAPEAELRKYREALAEIERLGSDALREIADKCQDPSNDVALRAVVGGFARRSLEIARGVNDRG